MDSTNLINLIKTGILKEEPFDQSEFDGLVKSANSRLFDANTPTLSDESKFTLAYDAAHSLSLAALRCKGYRPNNCRYVVFHLLPITANLGPQVWRVLDTCHNKRNLAEYEGFFEVDAHLLTALFTAAQTLQDTIQEIERQVSTVND